MADSNTTNVDIKFDKNSSSVRFRSSGEHPLPPSAGKLVTVTGPAAAPSVHGTVNTKSGGGIVFDNPA